MRDVDARDTLVPLLRLDSFDHTELFRTFQRAFQQSFPVVPKLVARPADLDEILRDAVPLSLLIVALHLKLVTQQHYLACVRGDESLEPSFVRVLKEHWAMECGRTSSPSSALAIQQALGAALPGRVPAALRDYRRIMFTSDDVLRRQSELDVETLEAVRDARLSAADRGSVVDAQFAAFRKTFITFGIVNAAFVYAMRSLGPTAPAMLAGAGLGAVVALRSTAAVFEQHRRGRAPAGSHPDRACGGAAHRDKPHHTCASKRCGADPRIPSFRGLTDRPLARAVSTAVYARPRTRLAADAARNLQRHRAMTERRVLAVDDEQETCDLLKMSLEREGFAVTTCTSAEAALELVGAVDFDLVITDLSMPEMGGLELCERVLGTRPNVPVVVITGQGSLETAIGAMRVGAYDFITKPVDPKLLAVAATRAIRHKGLSDEVKRLRTEVAIDEITIPSVVGSSATMRRVFTLVQRVADSEAGVLIHGETGTGKELVARAIHDQGRRKDGPFVAINCAAVPASLIESELFGHERGAFTDAKVQRTGLFVQADGGTLFLDEIGELPLEVQPKLLRALQERKVRPVGSNREIPFDARVIAATNRVLEDEVYERRFREDLFYRINVVKIDVPPLRERGGDVLHLARHFLKIYAERHGKHEMDLSPAAAEKLISYSWPGNVRELENCLDGAVALARSSRIEIDDLPEKVKSFRPERFVVSANQPEEIVTIDELERRYILRVLSLVGGNKSRAAQVLGFDRRTLYRKLERYQNGAATSTGGESAPARL